MAIEMIYQGKTKYPVALSETREPVLVTYGDTARIGPRRRKLLLDLHVATSSAHRPGFRSNRRERTPEIRVNA